MSLLVGTACCPFRRKKRGQQGGVAVVIIYYFVAAAGACGQRALLLQWCGNGSSGAPVWGCSNATYRTEVLWRVAARCMFSFSIVFSVVVVLVVPTTHPKHPVPREKGNSRLVLFLRLVRNVAQHTCGKINTHLAMVCVGRLHRGTGTP